MRKGPFVKIVVVAGGLATMTACTCNGCSSDKGDTFFEDSGTPTTPTSTGDTSDTAMVPADARRRSQCPA
jgi:hypothetical protein